MKEYESTKFRSWDDTVSEALKDPIVKAAYNEANIRREMAEVFSREMKNKGYSTHSLADEAGISVSSVRRLLHHDIDGPLTLLSIIRAANVLGLNIFLYLLPKKTDKG